MARAKRSICRRLVALSLATVAFGVTLLPGMATTAFESAQVSGHWQADPSGNSGDNEASENPDPVIPTGDAEATGNSDAEATGNASATSTEAPAEPTTSNTAEADNSSDGQASPDTSANLSSGLATIGTDEGPPTATTPQGAEPTEDLAPPSGGRRGEPSSGGVPAEPFLPTEPSMEPVPEAAGSASPTGIRPEPPSPFAGAFVAPNDDPVESSVAPISTTNRRLELDRRSTLPGGQAVASGAGCPTGSNVVLRVGDRVVGRAGVNAAGAFVSELALPLLEVGRHAVVATCGTVDLSTPIDVVLTTVVGTGSTGTVGLVLAFFVLCSLFVFRAPDESEERRRVDRRRQLVRVGPAT